MKTGRTASDSREEYLAEIATRLHGKFTPGETYEILQEMRTHIDSIAAAYQELGMEPHDAMAAALSKFGLPKQVSAASNRAVPSLSRFSVPFIATLASTALLGAVLVLLAFVSQAALLHYGGLLQGIKQEFVYGGVYGACAGLIAWFSRPRPIQFAWMCVGLHLAQSRGLFWGLARTSSPSLVQHFLVSSAVLFAIGYSSVVLSTYFKSKSLSAKRYA